MKNDNESYKLIQHPSVLTEHNKDALLLRLRDLLHRSLDPKRVIDIFFQQLLPCVAYDSIEYLNEGMDIHLASGHVTQHSLHYDIFLSDQPLGQLRLTRAKRFHPPELATLEAWIGSLVSPLRNALMYHMATQSAFRDDLTGVENRRALDQALPMELGLAERHDSPLSLLVLDIDHFKTINDRYGHVVGDQLLCEAVKAYYQAVRNTDSLYRYGGDEFVMMLRATPLDGALEVAERVRRSVANICYRHGKLHLLVSVSIGAAMAQVGDSAQALFTRADKALLKAKREGRNRVGLLDPSTAVPA